MVLRLLVASAGLLSVSLAIALAVRVAYRDKVLPGTAVSGVALGGTDEREARRRLATLARRSSGLTVTAAGRRTRLDAADVGFSLDVETTLRRVLRSGRRGPTEGIASTLKRLMATEEVEPSYLVDRARLAAWTRAYSRQVDRVGFPGSLVIEHGTLAVSSRAPRPGRRVDRRAAATAIERALRAGKATANVVVRRTRVPSRAAVRDVEAQARSYLRRNLTITVAGRRRTITRGELSGVLALERVPGRTLGVRLGADRTQLGKLVGRLAARTDRPAVDARLSAPADVGAVAGKGDLTWRPRSANVSVAPGRPGLALDQAAAAERIARAVRSGRHDVALRAESVEPTVTTAAARRVRRLIGTFTTRYACCEPRVQNIRRIARAVDGTVIAPGSRFSLNGIAGPRTRAKGYLPAPFIADGKIVPSVGGGVSQFATTMFNAAYFAGLRLDAHQPHSIYIDRYPAGREATVDYGSIDLAWTNDTEAPVLVRSSSTSTSVTVALYGNNGGRRVQALPGSRQPASGGDFAITVTRVVRYPDGRVTRQPYTTTYDRPPAAE